MSTCCVCCCIYPPICCCACACACGRWNVPQRFWDIYPETELIDLPKHEAGPKDMPPIAFTYEMDGVSGIMTDVANVKR